jgi:hypothetical protein
MKIFGPLMLRFEEGNWSVDPELGLIDTILELSITVVKQYFSDNDTT